MHWCRQHGLYRVLPTQGAVETVPGKQDLALRRPRQLVIFKTFTELYFQRGREVDESHRALGALRSSEMNCCQYLSPHKWDHDGRYRARIA